MIDILSKGYGINPKAIWLDETVTVYAKVVISYFLSYTGAGKIECWPSRETIALHVGVSLPTVKRAIAELEKIGWITQGLLYSDPMKKNKKYTLTLIECMDDTKNLEGERTQTTDPSNTNDRPIEHKLGAVSSITEQKHNEQQDDGKKEPDNEIEFILNTYVKDRSIITGKHNLTNEKKNEYRKLFTECLNRKGCYDSFTYRHLIYAFRQPEIVDAIKEFGGFNPKLFKDTLAGTRQTITTQAEMSPNPKIYNVKTREFEPLKISQADYRVYIREHKLAFGDKPRGMK